MLAPDACLEIAGEWCKLPNVLLDKLRGAGKPDFFRVGANSSLICAVNSAKMWAEPILSVRRAAIEKALVRSG